jgi:hypothetical protein
MSSRDDALKELQRQIDAQRARLDPKVLKLAEQAARLSQTAEADTESPVLVPYDRDAAAEVIRLFLKNHRDAPEFEARLMELLRQLRH